MTLVPSYNTETIALSLRPREAARALGISERKLWDLTAPRGPIPCARLGRNIVIYRVADLDTWLAVSAASSCPAEPRSRKEFVESVKTAQTGRGGDR